MLWFSSMLSLSYLLRENVSIFKNLLMNSDTGIPEKCQTLRPIRLE